MSKANKLNIKHPATILSTWFYSGLLNPAPGTWGTIAALPFAYGLIVLDNIWITLAAIAAVFIIGLWGGDVMEKQTGIHDDKRIVIDEVAGMWIAIIPATLNPLTLLAAFVLFRFFDILKPWPIGWVDKKVKGSFGVMFDDIIAGIFAAIILLGARYATGLN